MSSDQSPVIYLTKTCKIEKQTLVKYQDMMADGCLVVTSFAEVFVIIFLLVGGLDHFFHIGNIFQRGTYSTSQSKMYGTL